MSELQPVFAFALFPGVTQADFTGPHEVFSSLPGASLILASTEGGTIEATGGVCFSRLRRLSEVPSCDVVCVPVGATDSAIRDDVFLAELRRLTATARFVTSALVLGAAGLLRGKRAATHWGWRNLLAPFGAPIPLGWYATATSSPAAESLPGSILRSVSLPSSPAPRPLRRFSFGWNMRQRRPSMPALRRLSSWLSMQARMATIPMQRQGAVKAAAAQLIAR